MLAYRHNVPSRLRPDLGAISIKAPAPPRAPRVAPYDWAAATKAAEQGVLPAPYNTSSPRWTDRRYSSAMQRIVDLARRGDLEALRNEPMRAYDSAWRIMRRWRALAVLALEISSAQLKDLQNT